MKFDESTYEGLVVIGHHRAKGIWAAQTQILGSRITRTAGRHMNTTADSLLVLALNAGLQAINGKQVDTISARHQGRRPRLQVICSQPTFLDALQNQIAGRTDYEPLHIHRWLTGPLVKQLTRFDLDYHTEPDCYTITNLIRWGEVNVMDGEAPFVPTVLSVVGKNHQNTGRNVSW